MKTIKLFRSVRSLFRREKLDAGMAEEMRLHVEMQTEANIARGMAPGEARHAAYREFGHVDGIKERVRDRRGWIWLDQVLRDLRFAVRLLRKSPGFTLSAVAILAVGIGASVVLFSAVKGILFRTPPFDHSERLMWVYAQDPSRGVFRERMSVEEVEAARQRSRAFEALAAINGWSLILNEGIAPESLRGLMVEPELLDVLRVTPVAGRRLRPEDVRDGSDAMLISYELWQRRFAGAAEAIGKVVRIDLNERRTIVGVLPEGLEFPLGRSPQSGNGSELSAGRQDFWIPARRATDAADRKARTQTVIGRLRAGATLLEAQTELNGSGEAGSGPRGGVVAGANRSWSFVAVSLREQILGGTGPALKVLMAAVGLVVLLVCANVANLLLCRGLARRSELGVRVALGAGRGGVFRQLLTESVVLSGLGGIAGALLGWWGVSAVRALGPSQLPFLETLTLDGTVLGSALGLALAMGLLAGIAPAWRFSQANPLQALKDRTTGGTDVAGTVALKNALVVGQVAVTVVLLTAAALLLRSFVRLTNVDLGYRPEPVLTANVFAWDQSGPDLRARLFERLESLPWVKAAGAIHSLPLTGTWAIRDTFRVKDAGAGPDGALHASLSFIGFDYFKAMGVPLIRGRTFDRAESLNTENAPVAIVSESFARRFFPGEDALGKIILAPGSRERRIVGIVKDTRDARPEVAGEPQFYLPLVLGDLKLVVQTVAAPAGFATALREEIAALDPRAIVGQIATMDRIVGERLEERRFVLSLLVGFAAVAVLLGAVGIYALLAYSVVQRRKEIGIRMALGASAGDVTAMILAQGWRLTGIGAVAGLALAWGLLRMIESQLFEVTAADPLSYLIAAGVLGLAALSAGFFPARRAAKVDPMVALRCE